MPAGVGGSAPGAGDTMGTMRKTDVSAFSNARELQERSMAASDEAAKEQTKKAEPIKPKAPSIPPVQKKSDDEAPAASVLRMLFGKQPPAGR